MASDCKELLSSAIDINDVKNESVSLKLVYVDTEEDLKLLSKNTSVNEIVGLYSNCRKFGFTTGSSVICRVVRVKPNPEKPAWFKPV